MSAMASTTASRPDLLGGIIERLNGTVAQVSQLRQSLGNLEIELMEIRHQCEDELHARAAAAFTIHLHDGGRNANIQNAPDSASALPLQIPEGDQEPILANGEKQREKREWEDRLAEAPRSKWKRRGVGLAMKTIPKGHSSSLSPGVSSSSRIPGEFGSPAGRVVKADISLEVSSSQFRTTQAQLPMQSVPTPGPLRKHLPSQIPPRPTSRPPTQPSPFPKDIDLSSYAPELKHEGDDWFVLFNPSPKVKRVLDVNLVHTLMHDSQVICAKFSRDGKWLATGCLGMARIYDMKMSAKSCILDHENDQHVWTVSFSPDGEYLATGGGDKQIRIWDLTNQQVHDILKGHQGTIWSLHFSPNGQFIISGSDDGTVRIWDVHDKTFKVLPLNGHYLSPAHNVWSVAISPDGRYVAVGSRDTVVSIWEITTGVLVQSLRGHTHAAWSVAFTPDGGGLISGGRDAMLKYWDVSGLGIGSGANAALMSTSRTSPSPCLMNLTGHNDSVYSMAVSHDGLWVVSGSLDGYVLFWDMRTGVVQCLFSGETRHIDAVDLSPMGNLLAITYGHYQVQIWSYEAFR